MGVRMKAAQSEYVDAKADICAGMTKKEIRQKRSEIISEKAKVLKPIEARIKQIENAIESHEGDLESLNANLINASEAQDGVQIKELSQSIHASQSRIEDYYDELEKLYVSKEKKSALFDEKMDFLK